MCQYLEAGDRRTAGLPMVRRLRVEAEVESANAEALHAAIHASQLVVLPKLGHACVVEAPEACSAEIRRFVNTAS